MGFCPNFSEADAKSPAEIAKLAEKAVEASEACAAGLGFRV